MRYHRTTPSGLSDWQQITINSSDVIEEAKKLGITCREIIDTRIIELKFSGHTEFFLWEIPSSTSYIGAYSCIYKEVTKGLLTAAGVNTAKGFFLSKDDHQKYWEEVFFSLDKPLFVKPSNGMRGQSIFGNVTTLEQYLAAVIDCFTYSGDELSGVIVEEAFFGNEFRILASREKVIGIIHREPANVTGDGEHTVQELICLKNEDPRRGAESITSYLVQIKVDEQVLRTLAEQSLSLSSIPSESQKIFLRHNSNISTGGDSIDFTDKAHSSVFDIALRAIKAIPGLEFAGIDFMTRDITVNQDEKSYIVVEINKSPGFTIHDHPYQGVNRKATREFIYLLFPELRIHE